MSDALLIAAHGSRDEAGIAEFWALAETWQRLRPDRLQAAGFLEFASPTIGEAVDELVSRGAKRITVTPAMLMAAGHVKNDVPSEIHEARVRHPNVTFHMARALDVHPAVLELCQVRFREALVDRPMVPDERTLLLLVGRGTSDPDANANVSRVARFLWEAYRVGFATVAFSGLASPSVDEALTLCRRLGFARIVVQPYFLFDGVLLKRIHEAAARHAEAEPGIDICAASHLCNHPLLLQAFEERAHEAVHGSPNMNCELCKYRVRLSGREEDWGAPQAGHHHHVRAVLDSEDTHVHPLRDHRRARSMQTEPAADSLAHAWDMRLLRRLHLSN
ncbi:MAG: sirohydrochlorin chelatase [Isosphaeraceae bacterium]|nr:sirohydrochlorin chelatase [Isosphaeraceae bacterium]